MVVIFILQLVPLLLSFISRSEKNAIKSLHITVIIFILRLMPVLFFWGLGLNLTKPRNFFHPELDPIPGFALVVRSSYAAVKPERNQGQIFFTGYCFLVSLLTVMTSLAPALWWILLWSPQKCHCHCCHHCPQIFTSCCFLFHALWVLLLCIPHLHHLLPLGHLWSLMLCVSSASLPNTSFCGWLHSVSFDLHCNELLLWTALHLWWFVGKV